MVDQIWIIAFANQIMQKILPFLLLVSALHHTPVHYTIITSYSCTLHHHYIIVLYITPSLHHSTVPYPSITSCSCTLHHHYIIVLYLTSSLHHSIVPYPSITSYSCTLHHIVPNPFWYLNFFSYSYKPCLSFCYFSSADFISFKAIPYQMIILF